MVTRSSLSGVDQFRSWSTHCEATGSRALAAQAVSWIHQLAALEGQTAAPDARRQIVAEPLELLETRIEFITPSLSQLRPISLTGCPPLGKAIQGPADVCERDADRLRRPDESEATESVTSEPPLIALVAGREDESLSFIEVER